MPGCIHRSRALGYVTSRLTFPFTVAHGSTPWSKGGAVMPAVARSTADIVVVADADVLCDGLPEAIRAVEMGAAWSKPHRDVYRLSEEGTEAVYNGEDWREQTLDREVYRGIAGGGYVIARRETLMEIPLDPRFSGWGQEDESWALALITIAGPPYIGDADLIHLWHPPQERLSRRKGSHENWALMRRYAAARRDPELMRSILKEIDVSHTAPQ